MSHSIHSTFENVQMRGAGLRVLETYEVYGGKIRGVPATKQMDVLEVLRNLYISPTVI
jgi:hypothetical protein